MPFGLSTASCSFQKSMLGTLGHLPIVISYFDDVLIFSSLWDEHLMHIEKALTTLQSAGFTVKPSKTEIGFATVDFLAHIVGLGSIRPDSAKTEKISNLRVPYTTKRS
ncbi:retrovirus-related Pol polyprotein from transposon opus [Elysia marginata]|uniref:Retrovirus-related Pol polyprotein from transposon opus n=1 Tax=Elysia marginata TaxID=1093978 RepID=A0AAV4GML6_9GAST|nr:retrovirus-related Pol polyprotein from transposon opus [Elysia marginata]